MYAITIYDGPDDKVGTLIHSPYVDGVKVSWNAGLVMDGISDLTFKINPKNPAWNKVKPLRTLIKVVDFKLNKIIFDGRVLKPVQSMSADGMFTIEYLCESKKAYLLDSYQRYGKYKNVTISYLLNVILTNHNSQVEAHKRFKLGNVTVTDSNDSVYRFLGYEKTFDTIQDKLVSRLGGHIVIRTETDGMYLDYLKNIGITSTTPIRLRSNLKDLQKEIDPTEIITRLVVLGSTQEIRHGIIDWIENVNGQGIARVEIQDEKAEVIDIPVSVLPSGIEVGVGITIYGDSPYWTFEKGIDSDVPEENALPRLTMKSVNNGKDYLDNQALINEFGIIEGSIVYDDINTPSTLLLRANQFFSSQSAAKVSYTITPLDLSVIDSSFERLEVGNWYYVINEVLGINELLQIIEKNIDGESPHLSKITMGKKTKTLSQYQVESNKKMKSFDTIQEKVNSQSKTIGKLATNVNSATVKLGQISNELEESNLPGLKQAVSNLNAVVDVLNQSIGDLPVYGPVTTTADGLMLSTDKIKLDNLKEYTEATHLQSGLFSASDKTKLDLVTVTSPVDLNDIVARLTALETPE